MNLKDLFVSHKQVEPVSFIKDTPELPKNIYFNLDRAQKAVSGDTSDTSSWKVGGNESSTYDWKVGYGKSTSNPAISESSDGTSPIQGTDYYTRLRNFIANEEAPGGNPVLTAYKDGKYYSIGYGFNDPKYKEGDTMTREQADAELDRQLKTREAKYRQRFGSKWDNLTDNQRIALMSYGYNTGDGNIIGGNVAKYLDAGDMDNLRNSLSINTAQGQYNKVLDERRKRERELFNS